MYFLISYDIADPRRLRRVCRILESAGTREQFSVFLCNLGSMRIMLLLWDTLLSKIDPKVDRLSSYPIDARAFSQALHAGAFPAAMLAEPLIIIA